jgi:hypothetical protein
MNSIFLWRIGRTSSQAIRGFNSGQWLLTLFAAAARAHSTMTAALFHWARFIDDQCPAHERFSVARLNRVIQIRIVYFRETETSRFIRKPIPHHTDAACRDALLLKPSRQIRFGSPIREISNI